MRWGRLQLSILVFLGLAAAVQYWFGWESVLAPWRQIPLKGIAVAVSLVSLSYVVRTLRLVGFFAVELRGRFPAALRVNLIHNLWNNLLPTIGELSFPILMQRYFIISPTRSVPALLWFRLLDLYVVFLLALVSLTLSRDSWWLATLLIALLTLAIPLIYRWSPRMIGYFENKLKGKLKDKASEIRKSLPSSWRLLLLSSWWTLVNWALKLVVLAWIIQQFVTTNFGQSLLGAIGGELTVVLPSYSIAGVGTYEAGVVAALVPANIGYQEGLKTAVNLHLFLLSCTILSGFLSYLLPRGEIPGLPPGQSPIPAFRKIAASLQASRLRRRRV
jgi:glycosyltransferase 2 family protein